MANEQTIANLVVKLSAQTVEMAAGLKKAEGMVSSFRITVQKILGGISLAALSYKLTKAITDAHGYAARIAETAEKAGVSSETLSRMAEAADDVGVSIESLAVGLKFLSRNMFEAAQGTGDAKSIFEALGVQVKNADGSLRPLEETMLALADAFSRMEDGPAKTAIALKLLGRSGSDLIPVMNQGRDALFKMMKASDAAGTTISATIGAKSRELKRTLGDVGDAMRGISLSIMEAMLPALQSMAKWLLDVATAMNSFRKDAYLVTEALRYMAAVVIPLFLIKIASMISLVGIANLALRVFAATLAFFSGPIGWITAAIVGLSVAWTYLGKGARGAAREHEKFADSLRGMKLDELQETLRDTSNELALLEQRHRALREELELPGEFSVFSVGQASEADKVKTKIDELKERIKLLQGAIGDVNKEKIEPPVLTSEETLKKLESKLGQLRAEIRQLGDPVAGAKAALESFIAETVRGVPMTGKLAAVIRQLRLEFGLYTALQQARANLAAREKGDLAISTAANEAARADLKRNFDQGLVDVSSYYQQRRDLIRQAVDEEIAALEKESARPGVTQARKIEITAEIKVRRTKEAQDLAEETKAESDAFKELFATMTQGGMEQLVAENDLSMAQLQASYEDGLISTKAFFDERRRIIEENAQVEIGTIEAQIPGMDPKAAEDAKNKIAAIRAQMFSETQKANRDEVLQIRQTELEKYDIVSAFAQLKAEASTGELDAMKFRHEAELAELDRKNLEEIDRLSAFLGKKADEEMSFNEKRQAMEDLYAAQDERRRNKLILQELALVQKRMEINQFVVSGMEDIFGKLYDLSGGKMKAFFILQKAMAIGQIYMQAAIAAMSALAPPPVGLGPLAGAGLASWVWAMAAANIAIVIAQTIKGFVKGGPVTSGSGRKDDVPAMLTRGEYVQPEPTVRYYGVEVMEAIRRKLVPREILQGFGFFPVARPQFAFATGGAVTGGGDTFDNRSVSVGPININAPADNRLVEKLRDGIEKVVVRIMKEESRD